MNIISYLFELHNSIPLLFCSKIYAIRHLPRPIPEILRKLAIGARILGPAVYGPVDFPEAEHAVALGVNGADVAREQAIGEMALSNGEQLVLAFRYSGVVLTVTISLARAKLNNSGHSIQQMLYLGFLNKLVLWHLIQMIVIFKIVFLGQIPGWQTALEGPKLPLTWTLELMARVRAIVLILRSFKAKPLSPHATHRCQRHIHIPVVDAVVL